MTGGNKPRQHVSLSSGDRLLVSLSLFPRPFTFRFAHGPLSTAVDSGEGERERESKERGNKARQIGTTTTCLMKWRKCCTTFVAHVLTSCLYPLLQPEQHSFFSCDSHRTHGLRLRQQSAERWMVLSPCPDIVVIFVTPIPGIRQPLPSPF